jgi:hypothetical protein
VDIKFRKEDSKMELLKKIFPFSFKKSDDVANLVISIILHIVVAILAGAVIGLANLIVGWIPVVGAIIGWALGVIGSLIELYVIAGIVIKILVYAKVI